MRDQNSAVTSHYVRTMSCSWIGLDYPAGMVGLYLYGTGGSVGGANDSKWGASLTEKKLSSRLS